jgi:molybdopterin converting factor small subunit
VDGRTARAVLARLLERFPTLTDHLLDERSNQLKPHLAIAVDGEIIADLEAPIRENAEVHFVMAIKGGRLPLRVTKTSDSTRYL